ADQIKICSTGGVLSPMDDPRHSQFTEEEIAVIVAEARAQGTYVMAHAQGTEGIKNALRAGVRSIEHGIYLDDEAIDMMLEAGAFLVPTLQAPISVIARAEAGAPMPPAVVEKARRVAETHAASIAAAYEAGVQIAMGTDAGVGAHGENLEEIELMIANGMSAADALAAATSVAARLLEDDAIGRLAAGKKADLVLFDTDLREGGAERIRQHTSAVWQGGVRMR
ncbi:amidohydrolase family protein, partial [Brevibacterium otitidis]